MMLPNNEWFCQPHNLMVQKESKKCNQKCDQLTVTNNYFHSLALNSVTFVKPEAKYITGLPQVFLLSPFLFLIVVYHRKFS